jgi:F0F1-type ATP synthase assembly protein I
MTAERGRPELNLYALVGIGTLNLGSLLLGLGIGWVIDGRTSTFPVVTLIGLAVGIAAGLTASWFQIRKYFSNTD